MRKVFESDGLVRCVFDKRELDGKHESATFTFLGRFCAEWLKMMRTTIDIFKQRFATDVDEDKLRIHMAFFVVDKDN